MLKLIEFRTTHEGEILSEAFLTFGKRAGVETRKGKYYYGHYISVCIPAVKMSDVSDYKGNLITGWYGYRIRIGYWMLPNGYNSFHCNGWWHLLKETSHITAEQLMENQNVNNRKNL